MRNGSQRRCRGCLQIAGASPPTPWSADALFDYAGALSDSGQARAAADAYRKLMDTFPRQRASGRCLLPPGRDTTTCRGMLAGGARCLRRLSHALSPGEAGGCGAVLGRQGGGCPPGRGWPRPFSGRTLIRDYPKSSFRGPALQQTAEAYAAAQQYPQALRAVHELSRGLPRRGAGGARGYPRGAAAAACQRERAIVKRRCPRSSPVKRATGRGRPRSTWRACTSTAETARRTQDIGCSFPW